MKSFKKIKMVGMKRSRDRGNYRSFVQIRQLPERFFSYSCYSEKINIHIHDDTNIVLLF